ncbi:MAG: hypothetical protein NVS2B12_42340 [Ktedonobacteraceae bacterium]
MTNGLFLRKEQLLSQDIENQEGGSTLADTPVKTFENGCLRFLL